MPVFVLFWLSRNIYEPDFFSQFCLGETSVDFRRQTERFPVQTGSEGVALLVPHLTVINSLARGAVGVCQLKPVLGHRGRMAF